ncbi:MAG: hypothetical protein GDYSWBUE_000558 [Candidatus Fervidibacterota bacterium]
MLFAAASRTDNAPIRELPMLSAHRWNCASRRQCDAAFPQGSYAASSGVILRAISS